MRHHPLTDSDRGAMLSTIGVNSVDALFADLPSGSPDFKLPDHQGELEVERALNAFARENLSCADVPSFLGAGNYRHHTPASLDHLIQRGEFSRPIRPISRRLARAPCKQFLSFSHRSH